MNRAAGRLRVSQSTLTRQMRALEQEIGGRLFERSTAGVALTAAGHALAQDVRPVLARFDAVLADARRLARGQSAQLRIGYLGSAAAEYLNPALAALRRTHREVKVKLLDLSPGEQIAALRSGDIDLALVGAAGALLAKEFYVRCVASLPVRAALADGHPLAGATRLKLAQLRGTPFVGAREADMPGHNRWIARICRRAGFRPTMVDDAESLTHALATVVAENAVALVPEYAQSTTVPGVVCRPLADAGLKWDLLVAWQRGTTTAAMRAVLDAIPTGDRRRTGGS